MFPFSKSHLIRLAGIAVLGQRLQRAAQQLARARLGQGGDEAHRRRAADGADLCVDRGQDLGLLARRGGGFGLGAQALGLLGLDLGLDPQPLGLASWVLGDAIAGRFGAPPIGIPTGAGYAVGNRLVDAYLAATGLSASEAVHADAREIIATAS